MKLFIVACFAFLVQVSLSVDNGLGISPAMGWRSWNCYGGNIDQTLITKCIDAVLDKSRQINGTYRSLSDIGYGRIGVDDNWQVCNTTNGTNSFHNNTAPNGWANLNFGKFPNLYGMIAYAHSNNVKVGWYFNNCICRETKVPYPANEVNDVLFLRKYDFDGIKLDGCGTSLNITNWNRLINITGEKPLLTENCHNQPNYATTEWCPMNHFRSSDDINSDYARIIGVNLYSTMAYQAYPTGYISRPGCFAYPDMLEVGNIGTQKGSNASVNDMDQAHFNAWVVTSSPLILGFDLTNSETMDRVWDVITNEEVISISQTWSGHPGRRIGYSNTTITYDNRPVYYNKKGERAVDSVTLNGYEIWAKPQPNNKWAVLFLNLNSNFTQNITVNFKDIPWNNTSVSIRDVVEHKEIGTFNGINSYTAKDVPAFGSKFYMFSP